MTAATLAAQVARAENEAALAKHKAAAAAVKPLSFRSLQDALAAARDGDRIVMQLGHHNVGGTAADVRVRVLIRCACAMLHPRVRRLTAPAAPRAQRRG